VYQETLERIPAQSDTAVRKLSFLVLFAIALVAGLAIRPLSAQARSPGELKIFLLTMGQGDEVWEKFGHNAIWVHDPAQGTDWVYNYGVFDFNSPGYWGRFVKGDWIYQLAVADIYQTLRAYQYFDRTVTAQELNLTSAQARELQDFLTWNARPENSEYLYDYYRDNCSTRVRDVLDMVLGGALRRATEAEPTNTTYRSHSLRLVQGDAAAYTGLALALGPASDRPISRWEEMFLPGKVQEQVRQLKVPGPDGAPVPLVIDEQVLYEARERAAEPADLAPRITIFLMVGGTLAALLLFLGWASGGQGATSRVARLGFSVLGGGWALFAGGAGILLTGLWTMTNHSIAYQNENILQANPLALPLVLLLPALVLGARWAVGPALWLSRTLALASLLGLILQALPGLDQVNGEMIALALPINLALALAVSQIRRCRPSPQAGISSDWPEYHRSVSGGL
jgi:hypothetical protein